MSEAGRITYRSRSSGTRNQVPSGQMRRVWVSAELPALALFAARMALAVCSFLMYNLSDQFNLRMDKGEH